MNASEIIKSICEIADIARKMANEHPDDCCYDAVAESLESLISAITEDDSM